MSLSTLLDFLANLTKVSYTPHFTERCTGTCADAVVAALTTLHVAPDPVTLNKFVQSRVAATGGPQHSCPSLGVQSCQPPAGSRSGSGEGPTPCVVEWLGSCQPLPGVMLAVQLRWGLLPPPHWRMQVIVNAHVVLAVHITYVRSQRWQHAISQIALQLL